MSLARLAALLLLTTCSLTTFGRDDAKPGPEDAKLEAFFKSYLAKLFEQEPLTATRLGNHEHDAKLDDLSPEARQARIDRDKATLAELPKAVDYDKLSRDGQIDYEILRHSLEYGLWLAETFKPYEEDPRTWVGYFTEGSYLLFTQSTLPHGTNLNNAIARTKEVPRIVEMAKATITTPPRVYVETAIKQVDGAIGYYTPGWEEGGDSGIFVVGGIPGQGEVPKLEEAAKAAKQALIGFKTFLKDEVLPRSTDSWRIGPEKFAKKIEMEFDSGLTADEILAEAHAEADRVEREMAIVARYLWADLFPGTPVPPDDAEGRRLMTRKVLERVGDERSTADSVVNDVKATADEVKAFLRRNPILPLPEPDKCRIVEMPEFMRGNSTAYLNPAPPLDPAGSSEYAVSPPPADWTEAQCESYFREYNDAMLRILTIHEAYPGHYVQLEYSNRCPSLIRKVLSAGAFAEGWAVYTEQMMLDNGYGGGDLKLRLQQLKFYLRAVCNAILDHEMHAGSMTDNQAKELLMGRAFQTEGEALGKIVRSKQSSTQLSTYFVGRTAFYRLRQAIAREQGDAFNLQRFHEAALAHGTLPVKYLPEVVRRSLNLPNPLPSQPASPPRATPER
jgi:uncharacterized protein (DUF885 family)